MKFRKVGLACKKQSFRVNQNHFLQSTPFQSFICGVGLGNTLFLSFTFLVLSALFKKGAAASEATMFLLCQVVILRKYVVLLLFSDNVSILIKCHMNLGCVFFPL